jgi:hypothetical protein
MHTYELRNSREALRETEDDRGLQTLMLSILRETTVLVYAPAAPASFRR